MKIRPLIAIVSMLALISACSNISVSTDYDKLADFASLKTFKWHPQPNIPESKDARMVSSIMDNRIKMAIDDQLAFQGFKKVETTSDFLVNYSVTTEDKTRIRSYNTWGGSMGHGHRRMATGYRTEITVDDYRKGTLIIDIIDPSTNKLIWRGLDSKTLPSSTNTDKMDKLVNDVVMGILANFPPK